MNCKGYLALASGLVGSLAPSLACARDTSASTLTWVQDGGPANNNPIPRVVHFPAIAVAIENPSGSSASADAEAAELDANDGAVAIEPCSRPCGGVKEIRQLPQLIADNLASNLPVHLDAPALRALMVPVVTIEGDDGYPSVTFAVKPTKLTRGTGFVAIGRF